MKLALSKGTKRFRSFHRLTIQFPNQYFINWIEVQCSLLIKKVWLSTELTFSFSEFQKGGWAITFHLAFTHTQTQSISCKVYNRRCTHAPAPPLIVSVFMGRFMSRDSVLYSVTRHQVTFLAATLRNKHGLLWLWVLNSSDRERATTALTTL